MENHEIETIAKQFIYAIYCFFLVEAKSLVVPFTFSNELSLYSPHV